MRADKLHGRKTLKVDYFFDEYEKDEVKKGIDIVSLFHYFGVELKKKGKSFTGHCPWHKDGNPSLSVDRGKGLYNCFGCGESGDIFTLTEKMKGYSFKESVAFLREFASTPLSASAVVGEIEVTSADSSGSESEITAETTTAEVGCSVDLSQITDYYQRKLYDNEKALDYLRKRGLSTYQNYERFKIGFSDGSLLRVIGEEQKENFKEIGILRNKGSEHFLNCLVFPLVDDLGNPVSLYGRNIDDETKFKHVYLKGKHKGIFNRKASKVYDEVILTESIIDALSLIELGIENVQSVYGTNGFTEEHLQILKGDRVKTIIIGFDHDEAGKEASEKLKEKLLAEGFSIKVIVPDHPTESVKDWNEYLVAGGTRERIIDSIVRAQMFSGEEEGTFKAEKDHIGYVFTINGISYRVTGVKEFFTSNLRVNIKAEETGSGLKYYDNLDLYSARSRSSYSGNMGRAFDLEPNRIEKDLIRILEYLEEERDNRLKSGREKETVPEMSAEEKQLGMRLLSNPDMYRDIVDDMTTLGYVGEEENKLLVWLASVSRLLPKPMSVFIQSPPATGKSCLLETLLKLLPEESAEWITSMSDQSFNYMDEQDFCDKVFMLGEALHNDTIMGYIRQMQSENRIARKVTVKDQQTGVMKTMTVKHAVRLVFMQTSTAMRVNIENLSRCLVLKVDNSLVQTEKVLSMQRYKSHYHGQAEDNHLIPAIIKKHQAAQRLLKKIRISNPFAECIRFPSMRPIMRRGQMQFLGLIFSSCVGRQMQKKPVVMKNPYTGEEEEVYECDYEDYGTARRLFIDGKLLQDDDLPPASVGLYEEIRKMVRKSAEKEGLSSEEITFIQRDVREITDLSNESIKRYMRLLVEYEYLQIVSGKRHGTRLSYKLREDKPIEQIDISSIIPTIEELKRMMEEVKE